MFTVFSGITWCSNTLQKKYKKTLVLAAVRPRPIACMIGIHTLSEFLDTPRAGPGLNPPLQQELRLLRAALLVGA